MVSSTEPMGQGLLRKNPDMTETEFSDHWYKRHAQLVIPFFLHSGVEYYEQIHGPLLATSKSTEAIHGQITKKPVDLVSFSGAAALTPLSVLDSTLFPAWKQAYYDEVIKVDERRFLEGEALECIVPVAPGSVAGDTKVIIKDGKPLIEVAEDVWRIWREYVSMANSGR